MTRRTGIALTLVALAALDCGGGSRSDGGTDATVVCPAGFVAVAGSCRWSDPALSSLEVPVGTLTPSFSSGTTSYTLVVPARTAAVELIPTVAQPTHATIAVGAATVPSGAPVTTGEVVIPLVVTTDSGAIRTYTVVVVRGPTYAKASNTDASDEFGYSIALSADGSTMAVGAPQEASSGTGIDGPIRDNGAAGAGAVYVFSRVSGGWSQQAYIKASNTDAGDEFGGALAISADGSTLAVAAERERSAARGVSGDQADNTAVAAGAVYVFVRTGGSWSQQAYLKSSNTDLGQEFGVSVALSADASILVVGADGESSAAEGINGNQADRSVPFAGAAYVFIRTSGGWSQQAYLKASNTGELDEFGSAVAISADGSTVAVCAVGESSAAAGVGASQSDNSAVLAGATYVFRASRGIWAQEAYIKASNPDRTDHFGTAVSMSIDGSWLAVSASQESSSASGVDGDQGNNGAPNAGAVYVFSRSATVWAQDAYIKASNPDPDDGFGGPTVDAIALNGDGTTLIVGAPGESSSGRGLAGQQIDNGAMAAGAVYLFTRDERGWGQRLYLKAPNTDAGDFFGGAVAFSQDGSTMAVTAYGEASRASGIDGDQGDNSARLAGAAYLF